MRNLEGTLGDTPWSMYYVTFVFDLPADEANPVADRYPRATLTGTAGQIVTGDPETCMIFPAGCPGPAWA